MALTQTLHSGDAIAYHDTLASGWDDRYASGGFRRRAAFFEAEILPHLPLAGREWLDVGCGSGYFARLLHRDGARVLGVDGSRAMVEAARRISGQAAVGGTLAFAQTPTVEALDLADASVDGCLCLSVIEYLGAPDNCLAEMARVTRPGGWVVVSAPDSRSALRRIQQAWRRVAANLGVRSPSYLDSSRAAWTARELDGLAARHGLVRRIAAGFDPVLPRALWPLLTPSLRFAAWAKPAPQSRERMS